MQMKRSLPEIISDSRAYFTKYFHQFTKLLSKNLASNYLILKNTVQDFIFGLPDFFSKILFSPFLKFALYLKFVHKSIS